MTDEGLRASRPGLLGGVYGRFTDARRAWYGRRADRRRRLSHPVISVGNLASGGSGKTPVVAAIARMLRARGERPAILSRGYGRREQTEGVLVVSDGARVLEPAARSGDEPQMLARALHGIPILVSADRYLAGSFAERHFGTTVSLLDDGFQHVQLERDINLLLVAPRDLQERVIPSGLLREPLEAARFADALLVAAGDDEVTQVARALGHDSAFRVAPRYADLALRQAQGHSEQGRGVEGPPLTVEEAARALLGPRKRAVAFAGIARPERFFDALRALGWDVARELTFRDHHWFTPRDLAAIERAAVEAGVSAIITTEKDAARLSPAPFGLPLLVLQMSVEIEPATVFEAWILERLAHARACPPGTRSSEGA